MNKLNTTTMKSRIATYLIALFIFVGGTASSATPNVINSDASEKVAKLLETELRFPDYARHNNIECCALVRIIINKDGSFTADCVNCLNDEMRRQVIEAVEDIESEDLAKYAGQTFNFKINFKLI